MRALKFAPRREVFRSRLPPPFHPGDSDLPGGPRSNLLSYSGRASKGHRGLGETRCWGRRAAQQVRLERGGPRSNLLSLFRPRLEGHRGLGETRCWGRRAAQQVRLERGGPPIFRFATHSGLALASPILELSRALEAKHIGSKV